MANVAIKRHKNQKQTFCCPHYVEEVKLNSIPHIADCLLRRSQVKEHLRDNACGVAHVQKEVSGEEIAGLCRQGLTWTPE